MKLFPGSSTLHLAFLLTLTGATFAACAPPNGDIAGADDTSNESDAVRVCASGATVQGLDVSVYDGTIDWAKVKASGRVFAITRASDGLHSVDTKFAANWSAIQAEGLVRGVYQYFRASQDPVAQADLVASKVGSLEEGDLPPIIDVETADGVSNATVVSGVRAWLDEIKAKLGVEGIIYCASGFWNGLPNTSQFAGNTLWVANYGASCPSMPSTWKEWAIWQYSESGTVPGITSAVDLDEFNGTLAQLQALTVSGQGSGSTSASSSSSSSGAGGAGGSSTTSTGSSSTSTGSSGSSSTTSSSSTGSSSSSASISSSSGSSSSSSGSSSSSSSSSSTSSSSSSGSPPASCQVNGVDGECIDTGACAAMTGYTSTPGYCPGASNIECCTPPPSCTANGKSGVCIETSACAAMPGYVSTAGDCAGPVDIECCTPPPSCQVGNVSGVCIATSLCASEGKTSTPGYCPGAANIECCTP